MNITQIKYALALAEALNFTTAAKKLSITQPTLTAQINKLEEELGYKLFDRTTKHVSLTDEGMNFVINAKPVVRSMDKLEESVGIEKIITKETLKIGLGDNFHYLKLPEYIVEYSILHPNVYFKIINPNRTDKTIAEQLRDDDFSFTFGKIHDSWQLPEDIIWEQLTREKLCVSGIPEIIGNKPVTIDELRKMKILGFIMNTTPIVHVLNDLSIDPKEAMRETRIFTPTADFNIHYHKRGIGVSIGSEGFCEERADKGLSYQPVEPTYYYNAGLMHYKRSLTPLEEDFRQFILSKFNNK